MALGFFAAFSVLFLTAVPAVRLGAEDSDRGAEPCFVRVLRPGGWAIPPHGRAIRRGPFRHPGMPTGVTFTEFATDLKGVFTIPRYYIENRTLVLGDMECRADSVIRFEARGKTFAFLVAARGADIASAADVWWLDRDGDGAFSEFQWNPDFARLPEWVMKRLGAAGSATLGPSPAPQCGGDAFPPSASDHIVVELEPVFRVRKVEGTITSEAGEWPDATTVVIQLHPSGQISAVQETRTTPQGAFAMGDVAPGTYCFKATASGWQSVVGTIVVSRDADPASQVSFEMPLGR